MPATNPFGVGVDSKFVYWAQPNSIGRANLDGSGANQSFVTTGSANPLGLAVTSSAIFWAGMMRTYMGRVDIDGTNPQATFITLPGPGTTICGIAADSNFVYWQTRAADSESVAPRFGGGAPEPNFITGAGNVNCGIAVDSSFLYWATRENPTPPDSIARAAVGGGAPSFSFNS